LSEPPRSLRLAGLFGLVVRDYRVFGVVGEDENIKLCFLTTASRLMDDPLAVMFMSSFGAGKNTVADKARDLCPAEDQFDASYISGKALYHLPSNGLKHKLITINELDGASQASYPLRSLISAKALISVVTARDPVSGRLHAESKRTEGPAAVISTSSKLNVDRETLSRYIVTSSDESREQTLAIRGEQRRAQTPEGLGAAREAAMVTRRHHAFHRLLQRYPVAIPASLNIEYDDVRLCSRRDFQKVLRLIKAVAFARQMQKPVIQIDGASAIEVDDQDLAIAKPLIRKLFNASFDELSIPSRNLLETLTGLKAAAKMRDRAEQFTGDGKFLFTRRQVREEAKLSKTSLHRCVTELEDFEYIYRDLDARRRPVRYVLDWVSGAESTGGPAKIQANLESSRHPGSTR
jgi:hypothetical protein